MSRTTTAPASRRRHKKVLQRAKGFYGNRSKTYTQAAAAVKRAMAMSTEHRKLKKRQFRSLWIARVNAAARENGTTYSRLIEGLAKAGVTINRKMLSEIAIHDAEGFKALVAKAAEAFK